MTEGLCSLIPRFWLHFQIDEAEGRFMPLGSDLLYAMKVAAESNRDGLKASVVSRTFIMRD